MLSGLTHGPRPTGRLALVVRKLADRAGDLDAWVWSITDVDARKPEIGATIAHRLALAGRAEDARAALEGFVLGCWRDGLRSVLVITGKGLRGDGVLRRLTPEWLAAPHLQAVVAGISEAHRRHGGEGALYIALKRRPLPASAPPRP